VATPKDCTDHSKRRRPSHIEVQKQKIKMIVKQARCLKGGKKRGSYYEEGKKKAILIEDA
jgi:hypothetical protein